MVNVINILIFAYMDITLTVSSHHALNVRLVSITHWETDGDVPVRKVYAGFVPPFVSYTSVVCSENLPKNQKRFYNERD